MFSIVNFYSIPYIPYIKGSDAFKPSRELWGQEETVILWNLHPRKPSDELFGDKIQWSLWYSAACMPHKNGKPILYCGSKFMYQSVSAASYLINEVPSWKTIRIYCLFKVLFSFLLVFNFYELELGSFTCNYHSTFSCMLHTLLFPLNIHFSYWSDTNLKQFLNSK